MPTSASVMAAVAPATRSTSACSPPKYRAGPRAGSEQMPGRTASTQGQYTSTAASTETKVRRVAPPSSSSRSPGHRTTSSRSITPAHPSRCQARQSHRARQPRRGRQSRPILPSMGSHRSCRRGRAAERRPVAVTVTRRRRRWPSPLPMPSHRVFPTLNRMSGTLGPADLSGYDNEDRPSVPGARQQAPGHGRADGKGRAQHNHVHPLEKGGGRIGPLRSRGGEEDQAGEVDPEIVGGHGSQAADSHRRAP